MFIRCSVLFLSLFFVLATKAQTVKLSGKVVNEKNEPLERVTISVSSIATTVTDMDGRYSLTLPISKPVDIVFSTIGYQPKIVSYTPLGQNQLNELNIVLLVETKEEDNVIVTTSRTSSRKETAASVISFQKNTNTVASVIAAETIRRSPDRNTGEVLKRTPGASLQEGRFLIIRGLADRYNQAMLNGILLTSTEPDRKTFSFDLIPSASIDNIIINKAFVPEYPGEWAGGLIHINTKDIPLVNFFTIQVGTGFNTQTTGKKFYKEGSGGKWDFLGIDDGTRSLPKNYSTKSAFDQLSSAEKTAIGKSLRNAWQESEAKASPDISFQSNAGFVGTIFGKKIGGTFALLYGKRNRYLDLLNRSNTLGGNNGFSINYNFDDDKYVQEINTGALGTLSLQLNNRNKISYKTIINISNSNSVTKRVGEDFGRNDELKGSEFSYRQNTFYTSQLIGEHQISSPLRFKWYGAFTLLDSYTPDQRRILYFKESGSNKPYLNLLSNTLSQQNGSRIYQTLSDYIYTAGGDLQYGFNLGTQKQSIKAGYLLQVKDRLYDGQFFANYIRIPGNSALLQLPPDKIFASENFGTGEDNLVGFDAIKNRNFRYLANTILNAAFLQFDNQLSDKLRLVWGLRAEHFDQLIGSVKKWDPRHTYSKVLDILPGLNATYRVNNRTHLRMATSQTVIRPEMRELSALNIYDFELNASVQGYPALRRTKVTNLDLRYEIYPRSGEVFSIGAFYKYFDKPIEQIFDEAAGGASTFTYRNPTMAISVGVEAEIRKRLDFINGFSNFTFQANASFIYSRVKDKALDLDRPLQGQSPYVLNIGLLYDWAEKGLNATLLYNQIGNRIYVVGLNALNIGGSPDIYEASRPVLDFQLAKKILNKKGELRLTVSDLLNRTQYFYQNADGNTSFNKKKDAFRFTRKLGTSLNISFNYSL